MAISLGEGLVLRWGTPEDAEAVAEFNVRVHSEGAPAPEEELGHWTRDLMSGKHPTTQASDVTLVVDESQGRKVVSSIVLISQIWDYEGISFGVGRPELVATDPAYRRRGLIRKQFELIHAKSAERGEWVQAITGIPWYYRQFGYEMALQLDGKRRLFWDRVTDLKKEEVEAYSMRPATVDDLPVLQELYLEHCKASMVSTLRSEAEWHWCLTGVHAQSLYASPFELVVDAEREVVGYLLVKINGDKFSCSEVAVRSGRSWREVGCFIARALKARSKEREEPLTGIVLELGASHPLYEALGRQLERYEGGYGWYMRVADVPGFLRHIGPVLETRLAQSVMVGHTGTLRLNFYRSQLTLVFEKGKLVEVGNYNPKFFHDGDANFPDLTFLHLLFGHRTIEEVRLAYPDCFAATSEANVLINILFPCRPSNPNGLG